MALMPAYRPLWMRALNAAGRRMERLVGARPQLDPDALMRAAVRATKCEDFGDPSFEEPFRVLVRSLDREAKLTTFGRVVARSLVQEDLARRLALVAYRNEHPELEREEVKEPWFILGLPRTGTTLLYNLLARDPDHRSPLGWEVLDPSPPPRAETYETDPRIERACRQYDATSRFVPNLQAIHPTGARLPEECIVIKALEFQSGSYWYTFDVPTYYDWIASHSMVPAYQGHRRFLQHLQSRYRKKRWLLKTPDHLAYLADLFAVYPDARIIQTHRDPVEVIPSMASLLYHVRQAWSDGVDARAVGEEELERWVDALDRAMRVRASLGERRTQVTDVRFADLMKDPLGTVERIYAHFGESLAPGTKRRMQDFLDGNPREKHGVHGYTLEDFGLDATRVRAAFASYWERFGTAG